LAVQSNLARPVLARTGQRSLAPPDSRRGAVTAWFMVIRSRTSTPPRRISRQAFPIPPATQPKLPYRLALPAPVPNFFQPGPVRQAEEVHPAPCAKRRLPLPAVALVPVSVGRPPRTRSIPASERSHVCTPAPGRSGCFPDRVTARSCNPSGRGSNFPDPRVSRQSPSDRPAREISPDSVRIRHGLRSDRPGPVPYRLDG